MLCAWVVARSDEALGYVPGVAKIAAMILLNMAPSPGFIVMRNLLERHCMRSFYGGDATRDEVYVSSFMFTSLLTRSAGAGILQVNIIVKASTYL